MFLWYFHDIVSHKNKSTSNPRYTVPTNQYCTSEHIYLQNGTNLTSFFILINVCARMKKKYFFVFLREDIILIVAIGEQTHGTASAAMNELRIVKKSESWKLITHKQRVHIHK